MPPQLSYKVFCSKSFTEKTYVGNSGETRRCRICGEVKSAEHFSHDSHAISAALGNQFLICLEECDTCNEKFSAIESDFVAFTQFSLFLHRTPKRDKKMRTIEGRNSSYRWASDSLPISGLSGDYIVQHLRDWKDDKIKDKATIQSLAENADFSKISFIPQNIYKALCKYVISSFPAETESLFAYTARWILQQPEEKSLPYVLIAISPEVHKEPQLTIYLRNEESDVYPYCFAKLEIADIQFVYIVPDNSSFSSGYDKSAVLQLWLRYQKLNPSIDYIISDFSSHTRLNNSGTGFPVIDWGDGYLLERGDNEDWVMIDKK